MEIVYECCCGFDVHKKTVVVCLITPDVRGQRHKEIRTFRTMTKDLLALLDWLQEKGCTHIAMESTGVYWKPLYNLLEGHFELLLVNAQHIKAVPRRKTDVRDAEWIADLLQHGLPKGSFIPPTEQRHLRELTRHRTNLVEDRARVVNRLQKVLEDTNLKLGDVATDITGKSARAMLEAILAGQTDPVALANLARGRLKAKWAQLEEALVGVVKPHHHFLLTELLAQLDTLEEAIERTSQEIATRMQEFGPNEPRPDYQDQERVEVRPPESEPQVLTWTLAVMLLCSIPGVSRRIAEGVLAEIGLDMTRFPSAGHLSSWAGCVQAIMKAPANGSAARRAKAAPIYAHCSWKRLMRQPIPRIPISRLNTIVLRRDAERRKP